MLDYMDRQTIILESLLEVMKNFQPKHSESSVPGVSQLGQLGTKGDSVAKDTKEAAKQWYLEDRGRLSLSLRVAAEESGISKSTLSRAKREIVGKE